MSHTAEIIAVGTELLLGNITNTNASEISRALSAVGVNVFWHTVVGDNPERLREALKIARKRADVILTTGGLGPTYDDLTKQTVCETFGKPLVLREDVLEHIRTYFARNVHLTMPENNRQQAEFPADCVIFDNPVGTAPGCAFEAEGGYVLMLPGPPFEMRTMLQNWAVPYLRGLSKEVIVSHDIMTFGLGESPMEDLMRERISRMENPSLATYAKPSEVRLRATAKADSAAAAEAMLPGRRLAGISRAIRKGTVWLLTGALALFTLYLTVSGAAAGSADTVTARLARSAVGVLPVVGSILADAADSVLAGAGAVKNTVGAAGLLAVLAVCLLPLVRLGVQYLVYKTAAFLAGILGAEQLTGLIDALGGAFGLIFGMTGACGLLLLISISSALGVVTG